MKLRSALHKMLDGRENDLPASWRSALGDIQLDFASRIFDHEIFWDEIIVPGLRAVRIPNAPEGASVLLALEKRPPEDVPAVVLGQDPNPAWATGRAFERGNLNAWLKPTEWHPLDLRLHGRPRAGRHRSVADTALE